MSQGVHKCKMINSILVAVINPSKFVSPNHIKDCAKSIFFPLAPTKKGTSLFGGGVGMGGETCYLV